jgi:hypothetical protein
MLEFGKPADWSAAPENHMFFKDYLCSQRHAARVEM